MPFLIEYFVADNARRNILGLGILIKLDDKSMLVSCRASKIRD